MTQFVNALLVRRHPDSYPGLATAAPLVSVVLPVWNGGAYLKDALESVLRQTYSDFELIVTDDGSSDDSVVIAQEVAERDLRVRVLQLPHRGFASALNEGIAAARGDYIARMDCDDIALPERLQRQIEYLERHPACVAVGSDAEVIDQDGACIGSLRMPHGHEDIRRKLIAGYGGALVHPAVMMRKDVLIQTGCYRTDCFPSEDRELWLRLANVGQLANLPETLLRYRRHPGSVGAREQHRHMCASTDIVNAARREQGLRTLRLRRWFSAGNAITAYHAECARIALQSGRRWHTVRHACAGIVSAPLWIQPYAALFACVLPTRMAISAIRMIGWLRTLRW